MPRIKPIISLITLSLSIDPSRCLIDRDIDLSSDQVATEKVLTQTTRHKGSNVQVGGMIYVNAPDWSIKGGTHVKAAKVGTLIERPIGAMTNTA